MTSIAAESKEQLPALREDLQIMQGSRQSDGSPGWVIFDPLRYKYFQLGALALRILNYWHEGSAEKIIQRLHAERVEVSEEDITDLLAFLYQEDLMLEAEGGDYKQYLSANSEANSSWFKRLSHSYLFFDIPLVQPHRFLKKTLPWVSFMFTRTWVGFVAAVAIIGLYLTMRQWDEYTQTFMAFFNVEGMGIYFLSLIVVKIIHELGHAYTATRFGCRVNTMGVAFLVMFPVLYTDTTDAWRIEDRRKRLLINASGVIAEIMVASFATFLWAFLPDGIMRSIAFFVATTSWVLSLAVNTNPFMRFDGYYFFSDLIGVQNLQDRAFALGKWKLREILFALRAPLPFIFETSKQRLLVIYAWSTWVYRFILFLAIALIVYNFFFKALGVFLFVLEIYYFILRPVYIEMKMWTNLKAEIIASKRTRVTIAVIVVMLGLFVIPWRTSISVPAIMEARAYQPLYSSSEGKIVDIYVESGDWVEQGTNMFRLESPELSYELEKTKENIAILKRRLGRITVDRVDREGSTVFQRELDKEQRRLAGLSKEIEKFLIVAPVSGRIVDLERTLHSGRWVNPSLKLGVLVSAEGVRIRGYVNARDVERISIGSDAVFIPDSDQFSHIDVQLAEISTTDEKMITAPGLTSRFGGDIAVSETNEDLTPLGTWYGISMSTAEEDKELIQHTILGEIRLEGRSESLIMRVWRQVIHVLIREMSV